MRSKLMDRERSNKAYERANEELKYKIQSAELESKQIARERDELKSELEQFGLDKLAESGHQHPSAPFSLAAFKAELEQLRKDN